MKTGQIVEIPKTSPIYKRPLPSFTNKEQELFWKIKQREYSLFDGFIVGEHQGTESFKIGQRKGLNISGKKHPVYVIGIDNKNNRLFVGQEKDHPGLFSDVLFFTENSVFWNEDFFFENGLQLEISSNLITSNLSVNIYRFNQSFFLEFSSQILLELINYPIQLSYKNKNVATIKHNLN